MTAFVIAIVITIIAAWLIIKNFQPQTVLLLAGLSLLTITAVFYPDNSISTVRLNQPVPPGWISLRLPKIHSPHRSPVSV